jgi:hypothetical protein
VKQRLLTNTRELSRISACFTEKWAWQDSNLRPTGYEPAALPLSYKPVLSAMKSLSFHGNQSYMERETGLEPATPCLEGVAPPEPRFPHLLNPKSGRGPPPSVTNQVTASSLPPATCLTDFTIPACGATTIKWQRCKRLPYRPKIWPINDICFVGSMSFWFQSVLMSQTSLVLKQKRHVLGHQ